MKFTTFLYLLFIAALGGCAANGVVDQINTVCARVADHKIVSSDGDCVACYEKGKQIVACIVEGSP